MLHHQIFEVIEAETRILLLRRDRLEKVCPLAVDHLLVDFGASHRHPRDARLRHITERVVILRFLAGAERLRQAPEASILHHARRIAIDHRAEGAARDLISVFG